MAEYESESKAFLEVTEKISQGRDVENSLYESFLWLKQFLPLNEINLNYYAPEQNSIRMLSQATIDGAQKKVIELHLTRETKLSREDIVRRGTNSAHVIHRPEHVAVSKAWAELLGQDRLSHIVLNLFDDAGKKELGALLLSSRNGCTFTEKHGSLIFALRAPFILLLKNALLHHEMGILRGQLSKKPVVDIGETSLGGCDQIPCFDSGLFGVKDQIEKVAHLDCTVLLLGETGVGKEVVADLIHTLSRRKSGPLVKINCGALPDSLLDSQFFGHEKGAFTGAASRVAGHFERANKGTLFLDEIGDLSIHGQTRLLRVLEQKELLRVGGGQTVSVDARIIAATHRDLETMVSKNQFREDLWYRLNIFPIHIPPLRDRKIDIPILVEYFVTKLSQKMCLTTKPEIASETMDYLIAYDWPGNIRQLKSTLERCLILNPSGPLRVDSILRQQTQGDMRKHLIQNPQMDCLDSVISRHIQCILEKTNGKIHGPGGAAELLRLEPSTLRNKMDKLGIAYKRNSRT